MPIRTKIDFLLMLIIGIIAVIGYHNDWDGLILYYLGFVCGALFLDSQNERD